MTSAIAIHAGANVGATMRSAQAAAAAVAGLMRKWQAVVPMLASALVALWGLSSWFERQDWIPESDAAHVMDHARLQCKQSTVPTFAPVYPGYVDRHGRNFYATGPGIGPLKTALHVCARANLGPGVSPFDWLRFFVISVFVVGLSAIPLVLSSGRDPPS
jgi:hypothetical protein